MEALDGNAIAGMLFEHYGADLTAATGACTHCGATNQIAQLRVYTRAPGAVARCTACGNVAIVLVNIRDAVRVDMGGFRLVEAAPRQQDRPARGADDETAVP